MAVLTRIKNNQVTDASAGNVYLGVNAAAKVQDYSITAGKIANNLTYGSDLTVTGNLTVQGNTTTIDTVNLVVEDPLILLAKEQTGSPTLDIGFIGKRGTSDNIAWVWDESANSFVSVFTTSEVTNTNISISSYAAVTTANLSATTGDFSGNVQVANLSVVGNISGTANFSGNVSASNFLTTGVVSATGNVTGGNVNTGGGVSATGNVNSGNVNTGIVSATGNVNGTGAVFSGNVTASYFIGNISGNIDAAGSNTQVQFNDTGDLLGASANFTFDKATNILSVTGTVQGTTVSATGNVIGGNVSTAGLVTATGNVTGGNLNTGGVVSATGNVNSGNVNTGIMSASGNVTGSNLITAGLITATGNVTGGNLLTGGVVSATGNINTNDNVIATANVIGGNVTTAGVVSATGNVAGGNVNTSGAVSATGNLNSGNVNTAIVSASGNVTGANLVTGGLVTATGNVNSGNVNTGIVSASGNIVGPNIVTTTVTTSSGDLVLNSAGGALQWDGSGNIVMNSQWINGLSDPVQAFDAATKQYVDDAVSSGIHIHTPVYVETPTALPSATYAQGGNTFTVTDTVAGNTVVFSTVANLQVNDQLWFTNSFNGVVGNLSYFVVSTPNTSAAVLSTAYNGVPVSNITTGSSLTQPVRVNSGIGATLTATANGALTIDSVSVTATQRVLVYQQANAVQNGVYVVSDAGNVTAPWILTRSSDTDTYEPDTSTGLDQGSYFYVQAGATGAGESYVKTAPPGPFIFGYANIEFTQFGASQVYSANTSAGISLSGTVFSAKVDNDTTAFDGGGNISVKAGANLVTPNIGAATGTSLSVTGNVTGGNLNTGGAVSATGNVDSGNVNTTLVSATGNVNSGNVNTTLVSATGNVIGGNVSTAGVVTATGNVTGGNVLTGGIVSATGNIDSGANIVATANVIGGNLSTAGVITATGNVTGGNLITSGLVQATGNVNSGNVNTTLVSATGNVVAGNVSTAGVVTATGNVTGGNINTVGNVNSGNVNTGIVSATGNVNGTGAVFSGNVTAQNFIGNISGNIDAAGSNTQVQFNDTGDLLGASANFTFDKATNILSVTGTVQGTTVSATGNVIGGNVTTAGLISATGNITGANLILTSGTIDGPAAGRITINASDIDTDFAVDGDSTPNVFYVDAGLGTVSFGNSGAITNAIVSFNTTDSIKMPVGNTSQRPDPASLGMFRFSTSADALEVYTSGGWETVGVPAFTIVTDDQFSGTGACTVFTLSEDSTTAATIVSINGVVQIPTTAYSVSGNVLTFTEAPEVSDVIDARLLTTTTTVTRIENVSGNAVIEVTDTANDVLITGDIIPTANAVANIGSSSFQFNTIFAKATSAQYADLAEMYVADQMIEPGTVVCFGGDHEITVCDEDSCSRVAGVVSTNPSYIMNAGLAGDHVVAVALTGRVPTRVTGQVRKGDMMVATADGRARAEASPAVGQVIGKALADFDGADGVIEVVVGRL